MAEDSASTAGTDLVEMTLDQLREDICNNSAEATEADSEAWRLLADLAIEMTSTERDDSLVGGYRWSLKNVAVEGFRGAKKWISIEFDPTPGVTILHGDNGSGKSSITEGLRMALEGQVGLTHLGAKGRVHDLWGSADERSKGVDISQVIVHLQDADNPDIQLTLFAKFDGRRVTRTAELVKADGDSVAFAEDSPAWIRWNSALRAAPPVFAYAELANELQKRDDLQTWLSACLAMDTASLEFNAAVVDRQTNARNAKNALEREKTKAEAQLSCTDRDAKESGILDVMPIEWIPLANQEQLSMWLESQNLMERTRQDKPLARGLHDQLLEYSGRYAKLKGELTSAQTVALTSSVATALVQFDKRVIESEQGDNGGFCPVCGVQNPSWKIHLHEQALALGKVHEASEALTRHVRMRETRLVEPIRICLATLPQDYPDFEAISSAHRIHTKAVSYSAMTDDLDPQVLSSIEDLCTWVKTDAAKAIVEAAVSVSDLRHQWLIDRWDAVTPFLEVWQEHHLEAALADEWKKALTRWNSHLAKLRKERSNRLRDLVSPAVSALLGDVGIILDLLEVNKNEINLILRNREGNEVQLSHLSAGQRNALILSPVLGTAAGGIFQFCFLDDPVHAFDDFRVDQLAATLVGMGATQSLILTTHDGRFVEYLRVHAPKTFYVYLTSRDDLGAISLTSVDTPWRIVLDHASKLLKSAGDSVTAEGRADIAALLRMGMDESIEMLGLRYFSTLNSGERKTQIITFAEAMSSKDRVKQLRTFFGSSPQLDALDIAFGHISEFLEVWSISTHDPSTAPSSEELAIQIEAAATTCSSFELIRW